MNSWNTTLAKHYDIFSNPAPCDDCQHRQRCKDELLACDVFNAYVQRNQHWRTKRVPNRQIWNKIFAPEGMGIDEDEENNSAREH